MLDRIQDFILLYVLLLGSLIIAADVIGKVLVRGKIYIRLAVGNIFYPFEYQTHSSVIYRGYIRRLSMRTAHILCDHDIKKQSELELNFGSLPGFPQKTAWIKGRVKKCKKLSDKHYNIWVRFEAIDQANAYLLRSYIISLLPVRPTL